MPVVSIAYVVYILAAFLMGILSCLAPDLTEKDDLLYGIFILGKVLLVLAFLNDYTMY